MIRAQNPAKLARKSVVIVANPRVSVAKSRRAKKFSASKAAGGLSVKVSYRPKMVQIAQIVEELPEFQLNLALAPLRKVLTMFL